MEKQYIFPAQPKINGKSAGRVEQNRRIGYNSGDLQGKRVPLHIWKGILWNEFPRLKEKQKKQI